MNRVLMSINRTTALAWLLVVVLLVGILPVSLVAPRQAAALPNAPQALFSYPSRYEDWQPGDSVVSGIDDLEMAEPPSRIHSFYDEDLGYAKAFTRATSMQFNGFSTPDHVVFDGEAVRFLGYGVVPYMDMVYYDDYPGGFDSLSFTLQPIVMNFHSFSESGFLFNGTFTDDYYTGYALILKCGNARGMMEGGEAQLLLYYLQNERMNPDQFNPGSPGTTRTLVGRFKTDIRTLTTPVFNIGIDKDTGGGFTLYLDGEAVISVPDPVSDGDGFGFYTGYYAHSCTILTVMQFNQIMVQRRGDIPPTETSATVRFVDKYSGIDIAEPQTVAYPISEIGDPQHPISTLFAGDRYKVVPPPILPGFVYVDASRVQLDQLTYRSNPANNETILYYAAKIAVDKSATVNGIDGIGTSEEPVPVSLTDQIDYHIDITNPGPLRLPPTAGLPAAIVQMWAGPDNTIVKLANGDFYAWGYNVYGQLGMNNASNCPVPTKQNYLTPGTTQNQSLGLQPGEEFVDFWLTTLSTYARTNLGNFYVCGDNRASQLGLGMFASGGQVNMLTKNTFLSAGNANGVTFTELWCGFWSVIAKASDGSYYVWGNHLFGELGIGTLDPGWMQLYEPTKNPYLTAGTTQSQSIGLVAGETFKDFWMGSMFTVARTSTGAYYVWGANMEGELGLGDTTNRFAPVKNPYLNAGTTQSQSIGLAPGESFTDIWTGATATIARTSTGAFYCWGVNTNGALGMGAGPDVSIPTKNPYLSPSTAQFVLAAGETFESLSFGSEAASVLAQSSSGAYYVWGLNTAGELGIGNNVNQFTPVLQPYLSPGTPQYLGLLGPGQSWTSIVFAGRHGIAKSSTGSYYLWGYNGSQQLGFNNNVNLNVPTYNPRLDGPFPFTLTDVLPDGLSLVYNGATPRYTISDGAGNPVNLGSVQVTSYEDAGRDSILFTFSQLPTGTVRFTFHATVDASALFVNSASFFDITSGATLLSNETYHTTAVVVTEKYQAWGSGDQLTSDTARGFGAGLPNDVGDPYSPWPFRLAPIMDAAGAMWRLVGYQRLGVDAAPVHGWPPTGLQYDADAGTWEGDGWCWDSITENQQIIFFFAKDQRVTISYRDSADPGGADLKAPVSATVPGMVDYFMPVSHMAPFGTYNYANAYSLDGGTTILTGIPPMPTYPGSAMTSDKAIVLYFTANPVVTVQYREFRDSVKGRQNSQLLFNVDTVNRETFTFTGSAPYSLDLMAQPSVASTVTDGAYSIIGALFPVYRGWSDDGGLTFHNEAPPNLTGITATKNVILYFSTQYQVIEAFQANDRVHGADGTTLRPDVITDVWGGEPFTGDPPRPVLYADGFIWHYLGWVMDKLPPLASEFAALAPGPYDSILDGVTPPTIAEVNASGITIIYLYEKGEPTAQVTITERFREFGNTAHILASDRQSAVEQGQSFTGNPLDLTAQDWVYYGYQIDDGPIITDALPLGVIIALVESGHTVTYLYTAADTPPPKPPGPDPKPKPKPPGPDVPDLPGTGDSGMPAFLLGSTLLGLGMILTVLYCRRRWLTHQ